ncbi:hypothetical protein QW060_09880 [Myroides ceti]|uniref:DUF6705 domain-containing protein n=1 Tax=Paenimyroides ceti TaxID=395087 RepID=A0ABT8CUW3_9FLAO|nr:DUF6705 family protein [Paenimyroides ceti]MDN3707438.1 hypothetical protein [Paenimyroides ceti]
MKNTKQFIHLIILCCMLQAYSQQYPVLSVTNQILSTTDKNYGVKTGNYAKDIGNIRNQVVGNWRYQTPDLLLELKIEKRDKEFSGISATQYRFKDIIIIKYKLVKNGVVLHDNLNSIIPQNNTGYHNYDLNFVSYGFYYDATYTFKGFINDYYRQVLCNYEMQKTNLNGQEKLLLNISNGNYRIYGDASMYTPSQKLFSLPLGPILLDRVP